MIAIEKVREMEGVTGSPLARALVEIGKAFDAEARARQAEEILERELLEDSCDAEVKRAKAEADALREQLRAVQEGMDAAEDRGRRFYDEIRGRAEAVAAERDEARAKVDDQNDFLERAYSNISALEAEKKELVAKVNELEFEVRTLQQDLREQREVILRYSDDIELLADERDALHAELAALRGGQ